MATNTGKLIWRVIERILGLILLTPPLIGAFLFIKNLVLKESGDIARLKNLSADWTGGFDTGGYTSAAPIYLGLMAIAGALLIKNSDKNLM